MKAAVIHSFDAPPRYEEFPDPQPKPGEVLIRVAASALSNLARSQASGKHYSSGGTLPLIPGNDGVGRLEDGTRVYFLGAHPPYGAMAELATVDQRSYIPLPENLNDATAAAMANPGMSSWAALTHRAHLAPGETVLINGATGAAGKLAIQIAKHLGAGRVIATGRDEDVLPALSGLGADLVIPLARPNDQLSADFKKAMASGVDVILDYLWGPTAELLLGAIVGKGDPAGSPRIRYVEIGGIAGPQITLDGAVLRSSGLELMGTGIGSVSYANLLASIDGVFKAANSSGFTVDTEVVPLSDVQEAWNRDTGKKRLVFKI